MIPITLSEHAVERYRERVKPALGLKQARRELEQLVEAGTIEDPPDWWMPSPDLPLAAVVTISDGIIVPLRRYRANYVAVSCMTRAGQSEESRARRNKHRKVKQARRAMKRKNWASNRRAYERKSGKDLEAA